ncbi:hypothetical protein GOODEAATRI_004904, partial [Goodea atripinnis]
FFPSSLYHSSPQQAFNATAVVRHMRRLQLGSSMGSSMDASNPRPSQTQRPVQSQNQAGQNQTAQGQNSGQAAQSQGTSSNASKNSSADNNVAAPRKECESGMPVELKH